MPPITEDSKTSLLPGLAVLVNRMLTSGVKR